MKTKINLLKVCLVLSICFYGFLSMNALAQMPPAPPGGGAGSVHGLVGNQGAQGAPIGDETTIFFFLALLYIGVNVFRHKKEAL